MSSAPDKQPSELETLQEARKKGTITDSERLRLSELMKEEKEEKDKPKTAPASTGATKK